MGATENDKDCLVKDSPEREKKNWIGWLVTIIALSMVVYHLYAAGYKPLPGIQHRAIHICLGFSLIWLVRPWSRGKKAGASKLMTAVSLVMVAFMLFITVYAIVTFESYSDRVGLPPETMDLILGGALLMMTIEAARRTVGYVFPAITGLFVVYALFGQSLPEPFTHKGMSVARFI
ncbi:MAG: hypothetical protein KJ936_12655, partial [Proteobacteria bacterium]|nr:hypothetical protein [Pseudomonadota bacterium]